MKERGIFRKPEIDLETMQRHISGTCGLRELDERGQLKYMSLSQGFKDSGSFIVIPVNIYTLVVRNVDSDSGVSLNKYRY